MRWFTSPHPSVNPISFCHAAFAKCSRDAAALASSLPEDPPLEDALLEVEWCASAARIVEACLVHSQRGSIASTRIPSHLIGVRPLEIHLSAADPALGVRAAAAMACCISSHAAISVVITKNGQHAPPVQVCHAARVSARTFGDGWIARALIHPESWADAASVSVVSISISGRLVLCDCLPATVQVGYNRGPEPAGAVYAAAKAGDIPALLAALDAGGSTEEADEVRTCTCERKMSKSDHLLSLIPLAISHLRVS